MILRFLGSRTFSHGLDPNRTFGPAYEIVWPFRDISTADAQFDRPGAPSGGCAGRAVEAGHAKAERQNARDRRDQFRDQEANRLCRRWRALELGYHLGSKSG